MTDSSLELKPYLMFQAELQGVEVSPERTLLMLEVKKVLPATQGDGAGNVPSLLAQDEDGESSTPQSRTEMALLRPGERKALAKAELMVPAAVPLMDDGVLDS